MIPGAFAYHRPKTVGDAVALLADLGEDARPLAGGHSLIPIMKLRLAAPAHLVDLAAIGDLQRIRAEGTDIVIGAMTTEREIIASDLLAAKVPLLRETALLIADPQVRYVGTIGGNAANGDPGNDMPAVMMVLGATYQLAGKGGERRVAARDYLQGCLSDRAQSRRDTDRDPRSGAAGRARLRLREAEAQGRRLCHRRGRRGADR